jgi:two-component system phosphoglycerate transport system response regulator PgtA
MPARIASQRTVESRGLIPPARKILLVDEDRNDLSYYAHLFAQFGYNVQASSSYADAGKWLGREHFDFIVVSQGSRAFEGRLVVEQALMFDRRTPVLVLTRSAEMDCYLEAMQLGAVDYLEKPLSPAELMRVLETHLRPRTMVA